MKVAFVGSRSISEVGGVADYVRILSEELCRLGHTARSVYWDAATLADRRGGIPAGREAGDGDWLSVQFVPYAWHPRGFCFGAAKALRPFIRERNVHVMMHELWIGISWNDRLANHLQGAIQRIAILRMLRSLRPACVHTSNASYASILKRAGYEASVLPLFGNVPVSDDRRTRLRTKLAASGILQEGEDWDRWLIAGWFGTVHREWNGLEIVERLRAAARREQRTLVIIAIGRQGAHGEALAQDLRQRAGDEVVVLDVGEVGDDEAGCWISALDVALTPNPLALVGKSGTAAAFLEAGVPVLVSRNDWQPRGRNVVPPADDPLVVFSPPETEIDVPALLRLRQAPKSRREKVAAQFICDLDEAALQR